MAFCLSCNQLRSINSNSITTVAEGVQFFLSCQSSPMATTFPVFVHSHSQSNLMGSTCISDTPTRDTSTPRKSLVTLQECFSVIAYSNVILLQSTVMSWSLGFGRWLFNAAPSITATPLVGADVLLVGFSPPEFVFLLTQKINVFTIWFLALLTIGCGV
jgi:hypothetical protein